MTDTVIRSVASLAGPVKLRSVNWSAAFLYSCRLPTWNSTPSRSSVPR